MIFYLQRTNKIGPTLTTGGDVLIWQTLASVIIPGFTINRWLPFNNYSD